MVINELTIKNKITNKIDTLKIHQLVAMCFLGYEKNSNFVVDHIDNNKTKQLFT